MGKRLLIDRLVSVVLVIALCFLFWSSNLIEKDLKVLQKSVKYIQEDVRDLVQTVKHSSIGFDNENVRRVFLDYTKKEIDGMNIVGDNRYPNLLQLDPYFSNVIQNLLKEEFAPKGVLKTAHVGRPDTFSPFNGFAYVVDMYDLCVPNLANNHIGKFEEFSPDLALRIEEHIVNDGSGDKELHVYLRQNVYWAPINADYLSKNFQLDPMFQKKHLVTAHDFKFFYDAVMNPYLSEMRAVALRAYFEDIVSFKVEDDFKFVVRWKAYDVVNDENQVTKKEVLYSAFNNTLSLKPLPSFVYKYFASGEKIIDDTHDEDIYRKDSVWAQNFSNHWANKYIVSCGAYIFGGLDSEKIIFYRNPDFYNPYAALVEKRLIYIKDSSDSMFQDFKSGKLDITYLPPNQLDNLDSFMKSNAYKKQASHGESIREVESSDRVYSYVGWNCFSIFFQNSKVRRAITMAIDTDRIIEQCIDQQGYKVTGPFSPSSPSYNHDVEPWPYSQEEAIRLLEEEGWIDSDGDGIREKLIDGVLVPFRFRLCYYVKSFTTKKIVNYIATACKEIGIDCLVLGLDSADLTQAFDDKNFDAILMGWCVGSPPEDLKPLWHSSGAIEKGSSNAVGFSHPEADQIIDKLCYEYDKAKRVKLYHRFHEIIHQEAPYTFLFFRKSPLLYREYIKNVFIPKHRTDLIPNAQDTSVNTELVWIEKEEDSDC